jgi:hypothetical protein
MRQCSDLCKELRVSCPEENKGCRYWMQYEPDLNCALVSVDNADGRPMTLRDIGLRLNLSHVRIDQIEKQATKKLVKKLRNDDLFP